mgnify:CR=1 FL=1
MNFECFYGNERAKDYFTSCFKRSAIPHAVLITGEHGIGKSMLAGIISRAIVCSGENPPCESCSACRKSKKGFHPDIINVDGASREVNVDFIRALKRDALLLPNDGERKVYVIDHADALNHQSQDSLLKILEEPPLFTFFILLCYNYSDVLGTILSRCVRIPLSPLSDSDMERVIREKKPELSDSEVELLVKTSCGICSFLTESEYPSAQKDAEELCRALISLDEYGIYKAFSAFEKTQRNELHFIFSELIYAVRDAVILSSSASVSPISALDRSLLRELSETFSVNELLSILDILYEAKRVCLLNVGTTHIIGGLVCDFANIAAKAALKG